MDITLLHDSTRSTTYLIKIYDSTNNNPHTKYNKINKELQILQNIPTPQNNPNTIQQTQTPTNIPENNFNNSLHNTNTQTPKQKNTTEQTILQKAITHTINQTVPEYVNKNLQHFHEVLNNPDDRNNQTPYIPPPTEITRYTTSTNKTHARNIELILHNLHSLPTGNKACDSDYCNTCTILNRTNKHINTTLPQPHTNKNIQTHNNMSYDTRTEATNNVLKYNLQN